MLLICAVCTGYAQNNTTKADKKAAKEMRAEAKKALNSKKVENPNDKTKTTPAPKVEKVKTTPAPKAEKVKTAPAPKVEKVKAEPKQKPAKVQKAAKVEVNALPKVKNEPKAKSEPKVKNEAKAKSEPKAKVPRAPRIDRQINSNKFVFKGESMMGLTVSYGTVDSEDSDIGLIIDNIDLNGQMFTIKPHYGFFYRDNNAIGVRLGYSYTNGNLGNAGLNLGEANDISLSLGGLGYSSRGYTAAIYHRSYMSIDRKGRFGLFAEWELSGGFSESRFDFSSGESVTSNVAHSYNAAISFAPGVAVYIFPNVCASLSFGMGGLQYKHIKQMDAEGNFTGQRDFSKLRFGLNLAQINIGVNIHLWNKKKDK